MSALFSSGRIIDLILLLVLLEAAVLTLWISRAGRRIAAVDLLGNLASGAFLLLAVRAALTGAAWTWIAASLLAALLAHVFDLRRRLR